MADIIARGIGKKNKDDIATLNGQLAENTKKTEGRLSVKAFGAKGDGVTDDSQAIINCIQAAVNASVVGQNFSVYFPKGNYVISQSGVFSSITNTYRGGIHYIGDGWQNSVIKITPTGGTPIWLYDNGVNNSRFQFCTFSDLRFDGTDNTLANGFKLWSGGHEQGFKFYRCMAYNLNIWFQTDGTVGNSEHKFYGCKISTIKNRVFNINNPQSVNWELFGCEVESIIGDIFYVDTGGGGSVHVFGGSYIFDVSKTTDSYLVNINGGNNSGNGNCEFLFYSIRSELKSLYSKLVKNDLTGGSNHVGFYGCNLSVTTSGVREVIVLGPAKVVVFDNCTMSNQFTYRLIGGNQTYSYNGTIKFLNSRVPSDLYDQITSVNGYGRVIVKDCMNITNSQPTENVAINFDFNWINSVRGDSSVQTKMAVIKPATMFFPNAADAGTEYTIKLPKNSIIKSIFVKKPASGASNSVYQLFVGSDDKTTIHGQSTSAAQKLDHIIKVTDVMFEVGTTDNLRLIRLWCTGGDSRHTGGYAIVEYY